jgi:hypothetical protein
MQKIELHAKEGDDTYATSQTSDELAFQIRADSRLSEVDEK